VSLYTYIIWCYWQMWQIIFATIVELHLLLFPHWGCFLIDKTMCIYVYLFPQYECESKSGKCFILLYLFVSSFYVCLTHHWPVTFLSHFSMWRVNNSVLWCTGIIFSSVTYFFCYFYLPSEIVFWINFIGYLVLN